MISWNVLSLLAVALCGCFTTACNLDSTTWETGTITSTGCRRAPVLSCMVSEPHQYRATKRPRRSKGRQAPQSSCAMQTTAPSPDHLGMQAFQSLSMDLTAKGQHWLYRPLQLAPKLKLAFCCSYDATKPATMQLSCTHKSYDWCRLHETLL